MPKPISKRIDSKLMAYFGGGGGEPQKAKVKSTKSVLKDTEKASFTSDFGTGTAERLPYSYVNPLTGKTVATKDYIATGASLSEPLKQVADTATTGLQSNLGYLQRDPNEQYQFMQSGQDPFYNLLQEQNSRLTEQNLGRSRVNAFGTGNQNSTAGGAAIGTILNDDIVRQNQALLSSFDYGNKAAQQNANVNLASIGGLANLTYPLASAANNTLMQGYASRDRAQAATAAAQNAAEMQYTQAMNQYSSQQGAGMGSGIGSLIGTGISLAAAPFTGGASLAFAPALSTLGGGLGNLATGGGGSSGGGGYGSTPYIPNLGSYGGGVPGDSLFNNVGNLAGYYGTLPGGQINTRIEIPTY